MLPQLFFSNKTYNDLLINHYFAKKQWILRGHAESKFKCNTTFTLFALCLTPRINGATCYL